ncbi:hypothetical protein ACOMHN_010415 [Nucella lapillus]
MELDDPLTKDEVAGAIAQLQCGKSAGPDGIPPEVFKASSQPLIQKFTEFLCMCWEDGCLPQDLKDARIVHLYKDKGDKFICDNYRGISLLSIAVPVYRQRVKTIKPVKKQVRKWDEQSMMQLQGCLNCTDWTVFIKDASANIDEYTDTVTSGS